MITPYHAQRGVSFWNGIMTLQSSEAPLESMPKSLVQYPTNLKIIAYGFWERGTTAMCDILISNLNSGSYLCTTPKKALAEAEKENKDKYLQDCMKHRCTLTPMVYSSDEIP